MDTAFDFIIIGGGLAGQSLAWHLKQGPLCNARIVLIDQAPKTSNDRTWCFWEREAGPFDFLVCHRWERLRYFSEGFSTALDIAPYTYKMIRGGDFFDFMEKELAVERMYGKVLGWNSTEDGVEVRLEDGRTLRGRWGFSSLPGGGIDKTRCQYMDQHFKGWVIRTETQAFDPASATLMDFRVPQDQGISFLYTLPVDAYSALVELTFFSNKLFTGEAYDRMLRELIPPFVTRTPYVVTHEETGAIPMTDYPFPRADGRVVFIGTAGGHTKPSSGYTFYRLQKNLMALARQLEKTGSPFPLPPIAPSRFGMLDSTMLRVLGSGTVSAGDLFAGLFRKPHPSRVLKFLNEETSWGEDMKIMASLPVAPFLKAFLAEAGKRFFRFRQTNAQF